MRCATPSTGTIRQRAPPSTRSTASARALVGTRLQKFRQPVGQADPAQSAARPRVVLRRQGFRIVEAARRDVDLVRIIVADEGELRAAGGTEGSGAGPARAEPRRLARHHAELRALDAEPGHERRAGRAPADRAMAVGPVERHAGHFVAQLAAMASAFEVRHRRVPTASPATKVFTERGAKWLRPVWQRKEGATCSTSPPSGSTSGVGRTPGNPIAPAAGRTRSRSAGIWSGGSHDAVGGA